MKNENGYGGISYMGKGRRNPYRVRITTGWSIDPETGRAKQEYATLGYFPTRKAAMIALAEYNKDPYDLDAGRITFAEAYEAWSAVDFKERKYNSRKQLEAAFKKCAPLHGIRMKEIKKKHMQDILDKYADQSDTAQQNIKTLFKNTFKFCMENDLVNKDYSQFLTVKGKAAESIHETYTEAEIALLWENLKAPVELSYSKHDKRNIFPADTVLILIYTGMRPSELLEMECANVNLAERYMVGGMKTKAGIGRVIPIHEDILPLVEARMRLGNKYLVTYKTDRPPSYNQYRERMHDPLMEKLYLQHLPHDGRHTFATFADRFKIDELAVKLVMGHKVKDITKGVYTHKTPAELLEEVNKIVFYEK